MKVLPRQYINILYICCHVYIHYIRPIAVGCILRRLAAKCLCTSVFHEMGSLLFPHQLGFGTALGVEAAVHATRAFLSNLDGHLIIKLDFRNAFNSI